ncbi:MAG TPA: ADOP family duplicated permease [Terriglobia bacterium]|nr:ADOP family duplicated permease [Terriglobia bacterium]
MTFYAQLRSWLKWLVNRQRLEAAMDSELEFHIESYARDLVRAGIPHSEAMRRARIEFGAIESHKDEMRASVGLRVWDEVWADLRYAARRLQKSPAFTLSAVMILAVGIGVNVAAFNEFNTMVWKSLPVRDPNSLVNLQRRSPAGGTNIMPYPSLIFYREHTKTLSAVMATMSARLDFESDPQPVSASFATANYFAELGTAAACGRLMFPGRDDARSATPVAVLSFEFWQRRFGADRSIVGRIIHLNKKPAIVIGVTSYASASLGNQTPSVWLPINEEPYFVEGSKALTDMSPGGSVVMWGRLAPGVTAKMAEQELGVLTGELRKRYPRDIWDNEFIKAEPAGRLHGTDPEVFGALAAAGMLTLAILAVACANLGGLLLARGMTREHEIRIRLAIGASRGRIARQLFAESLLLASLGATGGLCVGYLVFRVMLSASDAPKWASATPDWRVYVFVVALSIVSAVLFGLAPALKIARQEQRRTTARQVLVAAQVAISCALLIVAGLLVRAVHHELYSYPGFGYKQVLAIDLNLDAHGYTPAAARAYMGQLDSRLRATPGVTSVAFSSIPPLGHHRISTITADLEKRPAEIHPYNVDPDFLGTMGIPLLRGRNVLPGETHAVVVSESLSRREWPGEEPLGKLWNEDVVVGVAGNAPMNALNYANAMEVYHAARLADMPGMVVLVKAAGSREGLATAVKSIAGNLDPKVFPEVHWLKSDFRRNMQPVEIAATVVSLLGAVAVLLAALGLGGLVAYAVSERKKEIAIRIALGAKPAQVLSVILRQFMWPVTIGLLAGFAGTVAVSRFLRAILFGISNLDALSYVLALGIVATTVTIAALLPARRSLSVEPIRYLRYE